MKRQINIVGPHWEGNRLTYDVVVETDNIRSTPIASSSNYNNALICARALRRSDPNLRGLPIYRLYPGHLGQELVAA